MRIFRIKNHFIHDPNCLGIVGWEHRLIHRTGMARESPRRRQNGGVEKVGFMDTYHHWENIWLNEW